jgi:hypothetical protein
MTLVFVVACGLCAAYWRTAIAEQVEHDVSTEWNVRLRQHRPAQQAPIRATPSEVEHVAAEIADLVERASALLGDAVQKEGELRGVVAGLTDHLAAVEADRDDLRDEAAKVGEMIAVASRQRQAPQPAPARTPDEYGLRSQEPRPEEFRQAPAFLRRPVAAGHLDLGELEEALHAQGRPVTG